MKAICTYVEYTKVTTDYYDIRLLVTISFISETTKWIHTIKLSLESTYQTISNNISYIIMEISIYRDTSISI